MSANTGHPASITYRVNLCSKCPKHTEYYCESCPCDLCLKCKENHVIDLKTVDHQIMAYRDKFNYISNEEICVRHPSNVYIKYCEPCNLPVCYFCTIHKKHKIVEFITSFKSKQQLHRGTIHTIRSETLFHRPYLLSGIKADFKTCRTVFSLYQSLMATKAQTMKDLIDYVQNDSMYNVFCDFDFKHRCLKQKLEMIRHIGNLQKFLRRYEQSAVNPLQFLSFIKTASLSFIHLTLHASHLSMTESLNKVSVVESLSGIQITEKGNRRVGNDYLLKLMPGPQFHQSFTTTDAHRCFHISCVTSDRFWVNDINNLILINSNGEKLYHLSNFGRGLHGGIHTINHESELIFIDKYYNINKLSKDKKKFITFIETTDTTWEPQCVYWSPYNEDLLVGLYNYDNYARKIARYNKTGQLTKTIQHENTGRELKIGSIYITENNNGDILMSDYKCGAVVVTERGGIHRFSYTGLQTNSGFLPRGICTDALSHIIVCDDMTDTVQMINKEGRFLSYLLIRPFGKTSARSLCYDVNTHRLLVGLCKNRLCVYRYITRQDALTEQYEEMKSLSEIQRDRETRDPLNLMLDHFLELAVVDNCYHISCLAVDQIWVSDRTNIILTKITGQILHHLTDSCRDGYATGLHTVNSDSELIYINRNYNIKKLSNDNKTTITFIERTDNSTSTWRPRCVYCSLSTGDLLVVRYYIHTGTSTVNRYNQTGELKQIIQNDSTGVELYMEPNYITENNNGDIAVSDYDAVVVTEREGRHRFSYTGHPAGSVLRPRGICTDALSHILVCDIRTKSVHMLDRDGEFLLHLLSKSLEMGEPISLSYDINTHRLLVGSHNIKLCVYRYISGNYSLTVEEPAPRPDDDGLSSSTPA
nr:uncharacterized protein LOC105341154 [Crassostrea gigas]